MPGSLRALWQNAYLRGIGAILGFVALAFLVQGPEEMVFPAVLFIGIVTKDVVDETDSLPDGSGSVVAGIAFALSVLYLFVDNPALFWIPVPLALWFLFDGVQTVRRGRRPQSDP
jgi:hypothetical protein